MRSLARLAASAVLVVSLLAASTTAEQAPALPASGVVERIVDGDTLVLHRIGYVRLIGVDTPESKHPARPVEYFAREAAAFLERLAGGATVRVEYDRDARDRYGRLLAYL